MTPEPNPFEPPGTRPEARVGVRRAGTIPGINGDEAWYGVQMESMLAGRPFAWATPSGLPLNPIHVGPLAMALWASGPVFWVLRAPAVASGLLLLPIAYVLLSRALDR